MRPSLVLAWWVLALFAALGGVQQVHSSAHLSRMAESLLAAIQSLAPGVRALGDGTPLPEAMLLASSLLAEAGHLGASRAALAEAGLTGLAGGASGASGGGGGGGGAAGLHRPLPPLALHAADTLARVGEFDAASRVHALLLVQQPAPAPAAAAQGWDWAQALYATLASPESGSWDYAELLGANGTAASAAAGAASAVGFLDAIDLGACLPTTPAAAAAAPAAAASSTTCTSLPSNARVPSKLATPSPAGEGGQQPQPQPSLPLITRLLAAANLDRQMGHYASAHAKLERAAALVAPPLAGNASSSTAVVSSADAAAAAAPPAAAAAAASHCALPVLLLHKRLLAGTRRSALSVEAALGDWRWLWAPSALASAAAAAGEAPPPPPPPPPHALSSSPLWQSCSQLLGSGSEAGGWGDVARAALSAGAGRAGEAGAAWGAVSARCLRALGASHPDTALALHIGGLLAAAAGNHTGALLLQARARTGLTAAHNKSMASAQRSSTYVRSLVASAEAMLALGQQARAARYLNSSASLARAHLGLAHPLTATARSLLALAEEELALQLLLASRCSGSSSASSSSSEGGSASVSATGEAAPTQAQAQAQPPSSALVCSEAAAVTAARATVLHYTEAAASWAAMAPSARASNIDFAAFTAHHAIVALRSTPAVYSNATLLEAGALQALLAGFNAYVHLDLDTPAARGGSSGSGSGAGSPALLQIPPPQPPQQQQQQQQQQLLLQPPPRHQTPRLHASLAASLGSLVARALALEGDHTGARAYLARLEGALNRSAEAGAGSAAPPRSPAARAAEAASLDFARAAVHSAWHAQLSASGSTSASASASSASGTLPARSRRERTKLLTALSGAADFYRDRAHAGAGEAGLVVLPAPQLSEAGALAAPPPPPPAGAASNLIKPPSSSSSGSSGSKGGKAASGAAPPAPPQLRAPGDAPPVPPAVDPFSFDTFLGDGRGYFASQDAFASAQQSAAGQQGGARDAAGAGAAGSGQPPAAPAPESLNALLQYDLPQVALHYYSRLGGSASGLPLVAPKTPQVRLSMAFLRYGILAYDCSFPLPPVPSASSSASSSAAELKAFLAGLAIQCGASPRPGVPAAFLALFNVKGILAPGKHKVLTRAGRAYLEALAEEADRVGREDWEMVLAVGEEQIRGVRSEKLAKVVGLGLPVLRVGGAAA